MIFIDTSVVVAILAAEDDASSWAERIEEASSRATSPLVLLEAAMRLSTKLDLDPRVIGAALDDFLREAEIGVVPVERDDMELAVAAFSDYAKGRGHPAQLNLADCLSYACAKRRGLRLLYKGNDFSKTDMA